MSELNDLRFTQSHEWVRVDDDIATVGITDHAQEELGDVALILFPEVGRLLVAGDKLGEIESIKAVSDIYAPVSGVVVAVNEALNKLPETINDHPYTDGWMIKIRMSDPAELTTLLDAEAYESLIGEH
ncbi:MAG: glycine cleavage system protein GcvH [Capsulimonadaceae bacterium]